MSLLSAKDTNKQHKAEYRRLSMKVIYKQLNIQQFAPEGWTLFYKVWTWWKSLLKHLLPKHDESITWEPKNVQKGGGVIALLRTFLKRLKSEKTAIILNMSPKSIFKSWTTADKYIISQDSIVLTEKRDNSLLSHLYIIVNHMKNIHCAIIMCQAYARV